MITIDQSIEQLTGKGCGFIQVNQDNQLFVHITAVTNGTPYAGDLASFITIAGYKKLIA